MKRVIAYIDGYNLYRGIKARILPQNPNSTPWPSHLLWLNLQGLAKSLLKDDETLTQTHYFTAGIPSPEGSRIRQNLFIDALNTLSDFEITYGRFQKEYDNTCHQCGSPMYASKEKMTDVNIAVQMLKDAQKNRFDKALLITGDTDQVSVINAIRDGYSDKTVFVAFPPERFNDHLETAATVSARIGRSRLEENLFADQIERQDGFMLRNPWKFNESE